MRGQIEITFTIQHSPAVGADAANWRFVRKVDLYVMRSECRQSAQNGQIAAFSGP